jgi:hypothetical protein
MFTGGGLQTLQAQAAGRKVRKIMYYNFSVYSEKQSAVGPLRKHKS